MESQRATRLSDILDHINQQNARQDVVGTTTFAKPIQATSLIIAGSPSACGRAAWPADVSVRRRVLSNVAKMHSLDKGTGTKAAHPFRQKRMFCEHYQRIACLLALQVDSCSRGERQSADMALQHSSQHRLHRRTLRSLLERS